MNLLKGIIFSIKETISLTEERLPDVRPGIYYIMEVSDGRIYFEDSFSKQTSQLSNAVLQLPEKIGGMFITTYVDYEACGIIQRLKHLESCFGIDYSDAEDKIVAILMKNGKMVDHFEVYKSAMQCGKTLTSLEMVKYLIGSDPVPLLPILGLKYIAMTEKTRRKELGIDPEILKAPKPNGNKRVYLKPTLRSVSISSNNPCKEIKLESFTPKDTDSVEVLVDIDE